LFGILSFNAKLTNIICDDEGSLPAAGAFWE
jgi:hypothetical protein